MPKAKTKTKGMPSLHHYVYPGTNTLKNKYRTKDFITFVQKSRHDTEKAATDLRKEPLPERFDSTYLCRIHHQLFQKTFEWAGLTRDVPFTFADGTTAVMPGMQKKDSEVFFAVGDEIQEGLQKLEQTLAEKNNLRGLTREDFVKEATPIFVSLNQLHPFRDGNGRVQRVFFENLAKAAGHQLDFSLATKERLTTASIAAAQDGDLEPMHHLFEDISHPEKRRILKEFMNSMKALGRNVNDRPVMVAKEGETYSGTYRGAGVEGFTVNVKGAYIIGNKDYLAPEQLKTLKPGDKFTFTVPKAQDLENTLIPKEARTSLTQDEYAEMISQDACVNACREQIQKSAKIVYGSSKILNAQMEELIKNPNLSQQLATQIAKRPHSIAHLAGFDFICLKNQARADAEEHIETLCHAVTNFAHAVKNAKREITKEHQAEQKRCGQKVAMPNQNLQNLFALPKELQQETLQASPSLQKELRGFVTEINARLSSNEQKAIKNNDHETLAKSLGVSERKAQEITDITKQAKEIHQQSQVRTSNRSKGLAMAS
ncbi:BID domain-containing T4SS effector [Bartonella machadoae]|uniref:BID domain-containing T4SS effector n=1 Tax=Bartonella machadoae TaxID=2893471 RepID=UPI001F4CB022|nr:BID domain-containing T4SS effector [Bartonella machadoae]UNE53785.1 BID domain-containing T4SS effector [Bartonella machadoae]